MNSSILIIGGFGFMGRNLYQHLVQAGYSTVNIMSNVPLSTEDPFRSVFNHRLYLGSINDKKLVEEVISDHEVIFSLAGLSGAASSISSPFEDLRVNLEGHLNILEACRKKGNNNRIIFPSTRLVYGKPLTLPVSETHPLDPQSIYAIHKNTAEYYYLLYSKLYALKTVVYRISNPYGYNYNPEGISYSVLNQFIHKAIIGEPIQLFGDGTQKRDYLHINDLSRIMEETIHNETLTGNIYNIGSGIATSIIEVVRTIQEVIPGTTFKLVDWPSLEKNIETGDYYSDLSKIMKDTHWKPSIDLRTGIRITADAYRNQE
ncbi:MAG: NAD-dependent epimerase/dehydratase family protein [Bacteroidota bacterium]